MDEKWWREYIREVRTRFQGLKVSTTQSSSLYHLERAVQNGLPMETFGNSGGGAIALAFLWGAQRVILLGYDCQRTHGKTHWHGDHPKTLGNARSLPKWTIQFSALRKKLAGEIINCSRETALTMFPRMPLEDALCPS